MSDGVFIGIPDFIFSTNDQFAIRTREPVSSILQGQSSHFPTSGMSSVFEQHFFINKLRIQRSYNLSIMLLAFYLPCLRMRSLNLIFTIFLSATFRGETSRFSGTLFFWRSQIPNTSLSELPNSNWVRMSQSAFNGPPNSNWVRIS